MKEVLEHQSDRIEAVLALHKVPARVTGGTYTPRWVRFQVLPAVGAKISKIKGLSEELAATLDAPSCRISRRGAAIDIEIPRDDPQQVRLLPLFRQLDDNHKPFPPVTAILGLAEDGAPLLIRLPSPDVGHVLIVGMSGAGKTSLLRTILLSLAMTNSSDDLAFVFMGDGLPNTMYSIEQLGFSVHRITTMRQALAAHNVYGKRIILTADDVVGEGNNVASTFSRLMQVSDKIHYILAWDGVPPSEMVDLFNVRLVGHMSSVEDARIVTDHMGTGAERLIGKGDFLAVTKKGVIPFQAACVGTNTLDRFQPESVSKTLTANA